MVAVGPRFQDRDNRAAVGVSVGRWRIGRDDANFANCVGRGIVGDEVVLRFVQVGAFQRVVVCLGAIPVDGGDAVIEGVALDRIIPSQARRIGVDGSGLIQRQRRKVASVQRNVCDLIGGDGVSQGRIGRVKDRMNVRLHLHGARHADFHVGIDLRRLVDL